MYAKPEAASDGDIWRTRSLFFVCKNTKDEITSGCMLSNGREVLRKACI